MSDLPQDDNAPPLTNMDPNLEEFRQAFTHEDGQEWADEVTTRLNDYYQSKAVARQNDAAANAFMTNMGDFQQGLSDFVTRDPMAVHTALDLVQPTIASMINSHPTHPDDQRQPAHDALVGDISTAVARSAVISAAEKHEDMARGLLNDERIGSHLSDDDKAGLSSYIDMQELARGADASAVAQQNARLAQQRQAAVALGHASFLHDPQTDSVRFSPNWASNLMADRITSPQDKKDLMDLYGRLQNFGDADRSDPFMVAQAINRALSGDPMSHTELIQNAGDALRVPDALWLGRHTVQDSVAGQGYLAQVDAHIQAARREYLSEPSAAGARAFGNFVNWLMPRVRGGAVLNPAADEYALGENPAQSLHHFRVTGNDLLPTPVEREPRSLAAIFGGQA